MSLVRVHNMSVSLDGFGTGAGQSLEAPFGHAGGRLVQWFTGTRSFHAMQPLWDGLEGLEERFVIESVSSLSGVTHITFTRR